MKGALLLITVVISVARAQNATYHDADELARYLFDDTRYNKEVRPLLNQSRTLEVNVSLTVYNLVKMVLSEQRGEIAAEVVISWRDQLLTWDPVLYNGIDVISLPKGSFWHPELAVSVVPQAITGTFLSAWLASTGDVTMIVSSVLSFGCEIDTTYFPLDRHECFWSSFSERYSSRNVKLRLNDVLFSEKNPNSEWTMESTFAFSFPSKMNTPEQSMNVSIDILTVLFTVQRRGRFMTVSVICPGMLITLLNILTCLVPAHSGERLSFSITVLLSLAFFTIALMDDLPASSLTMPLISYLFVFFNSLNTITVIWSVFIVNIANKSDSKNIPRLFKHIWNKSRPEQTEGSRPDRIGDETILDTLDIDINSKHRGNSRQLGHVNSYRQNDSVKTSKHLDVTDSDSLTWSQLAKKLDMCFFSTMIILTVASNIVMWAYMYPKGLEASEVS